MKIVTLIARILLGLGFLIFGLNGFLNFLRGPLPPGPPGDFLTILIHSHWAMFMSAVELVAAVLFLINRYVPLALTLLGPILVNILCYHLFLMAGQAITGGLVFTALWFLVFYAHRAAFSGIFAAKA